MFLGIWALRMYQSDVVFPETNVDKHDMPKVTRDHKPSCSEDVDINEINRLMGQVAAEMDLDARKAIAGLEEDKELMARLEQLKRDRKQRQLSSKCFTIQHV